MKKSPTHCFLRLAAVRAFFSPPVSVESSASRRPGPGFVSGLGAVAFSCLLLGGCCSSGGVPDPAASKIKVGDVVSQVQEALERVQVRLEEAKLPPLQSVNLTLETTLSNKGSAGFDVWVLSLGTSYSKDRVQSVSITLAPPAAKEGVNLRALQEQPSLTDSLELAIVSAIAELKAHYPNQKIPLDVTEIDVTLGFTVTVDGSAGIKIAPISLELGGETSKSTAHTITVVYANK
jgi:hypothetical protein